MSERKYYCYCDSNCKFETMTKEQILAAIAQAAESGLVFDTEAAFITKVKERNAGGFVTFWAGTQAQYNALETVDANCFYLITDSTKDKDIAEAVATAVANANAALATANEAKASAASAQAAAKAAQSTADTAKANASAAQTAAKAAQSTADTAQTTANAASAAAATAQHAADGAQSTANAANSAAAAAQSTANSASATANAALPKSGGTMTGQLKTKGLVLTSGTDYGDSLPAAGTAGRVFFLKS